MRIYKLNNVPFSGLGVFSSFGALNYSVYEIPSSEIFGLASAMLASIPH
jgi:hypothetical protein